MEHLKPRKRGQKTLLSPINAHYINDNCLLKRHLSTGTVDALTPTAVTEKPSGDAPNTPNAAARGNVPNLTGFLCLDKSGRHIHMLEVSVSLLTRGCCGYPNSMPPKIDTENFCCYFLFTADRIS